jgi:hypothetical protein
VSKLDEIDGGREWLQKAMENGLSYNTYYVRVVRDGRSPDEAATSPIDRGGQKPQPTSITQRCKAAGIKRRTYYNIREELRDKGLDHTVEAVLEIAQSRKSQ